jgi:hypothetical protein
MDEGGWLEASDSVLIERSLSGKLGAFDELMARYQGLVFKIAITYTRDREGALDISQNAFLKMLNDPSVAVRLKALTTLAAYKQDPEVQAAFLEILKTAESVQMRLLAIDYLVESRVDPTVMRDALRHLRPTEDAAALVKASAYLQ